VAGKNCKGESKKHEKEESMGRKLVAKLKKGKKKK